MKKEIELKDFVINAKQGEKRKKAVLGYFSCSCCIAYWARFYSNLTKLMNIK